MDSSLPSLLPEVSYGGRPNCRNPTVLRHRQGAALSLHSREQSSIVGVKGKLLAPAASALGDAVEARARRGEPRILLDLTELHDIDAAGVGELVRAFTTMRAAGGSLRVAHPTRYVRKLLEVAGLFALLTSHYAREHAP
jgi:anti-sigma B factor antagonist